MLFLVFFCISISLFRRAVLRKKISSCCTFIKLLCLVVGEVRVSSEPDAPKARAGVQVVLGPQWGSSSLDSTLWAEPIAAVLRPGSGGFEGIFRFGLARFFELTPFLSACSGWEKLFTLFTPHGDPGSGFGCVGGGTIHRFRIKPFTNARQAKEQRLIEDAHLTDVVSIRGFGGVFHDP